MSSVTFEWIFFTFKSAIDYNNKTFKFKVFCWYLKDVLSKKFSLDADVFALKKKKHVHIAFKIPISEYESFHRLIDFISDDREKTKVFSEDYKMIYLRLITSLKWKFDYVFFERKGKNGKQLPRKNV